VFRLHRPTGQEIERFLQDSARLPLSYAPIGLVHAQEAGYDIDEVQVVVGRGDADFARARSELIAWKQFEIGWVELFPRDAPVEKGTVVAVLARHAGFWSLHGCRVVSVLEEDNTRFALAYGTLTNHAEIGEELFEVFRNPDTDAVCYRIRAVSRPGTLVTRLGYPIARMLQSRFRRDSVEAMSRAVGQSSRSA
jgi:uncharacterized protein (UPF0548 family)